MARPHPLANFQPSVDYDLTRVLDGALRADGILEARREAIAAVVAGPDASAVDRYRPTILAQLWMDEVARFIRDTRLVGHKDRKRQTVADAAAERFDDIFPGIAHSTNLRFLLAEDDKVIGCDAHNRIFEIPMDEDAAVSLMLIARTLVTEALVISPPDVKRCK